jgi:hypothetical protein
LQDARIDVAGIKRHPWFNKPPSPGTPYAEALAALQREQAALEKEMAAAPTSLPERDKQLEVSGIVCLCPFADRSQALYTSAA